MKGYSTREKRPVIATHARSQHFQDLKVKTVGVSQYGSQGDTFLRDGLKKFGLRPDADVVILQMGGTPQVGAALAAGVVGESGLMLIQQGRAKRCPAARRES